ncbi:protein DELAY OF GERMINATION 1-like [Salvia splendens]|uniref:protein DELAY OF GERMINATION 1-like n=1 Tax=Salvia splendens TaxID=180675 RepID=UPI001C255DDE|nr:protein DELAY OF GERMINATION 1-like [Salvia splendens]
MASTNHRPFRCSFHSWMAQQQQDLDELVAANSPATDKEDLARLRDKCVAHFGEYAERRAAMARQNPPCFLSPPWCSALQNAFMWVGGCRPSLFIRLIYHVCSSQLDSRSREYHVVPQHLTCLVLRSFTLFNFIAHIHPDSSVDGNIGDAVGNIVNVFGNIRTQYHRESVINVPLSYIFIISVLLKPSGHTGEQGGLVQSIHTRGMSREAGTAHRSKNSVACAPMAGPSKWAVGSGRVDIVRGGAYHVDRIVADLTIQSDGVVADIWVAMGGGVVADIWAAMGGGRIAAHGSRIGDGNRQHRMGNLADLTARQLVLINALHCKTVKEEDKFSTRITSLQEEIADEPLATMAKQSVGEVERAMAMVAHEAAMAEVLLAADRLRMETLKEVMGILTPLQAVDLLIAGKKLHISMHCWGCKREEQTSTTTN